MGTKLSDKKLRIMKNESSFANLKLILLKDAVKGNRYYDK